MSYGFYGPTFRQRLLGYAAAGTRVSVLVDGVTLTGRVVAVDLDNFEMVLTRPAVVAGTIVNVSFARLETIAAIS
ncbi:hypothetical protein LSG31_07700 [Fodinisporobacter ferrooxydans]|uniref:Uncharacterized protein n=1 Tax=Fodinisporobacter ferrooxydans TaxID=2901836 RepID=A0ABY4CW20_9BACL|nr:hypothetical protein LSG31_07700 [Alicyclobacillaceae bacterium MYW30-H2]